MSKVCLSSERVNHLINRVETFADNMEREANYLKKEITEIKKELKIKGSVGHERTRDSL